MLAGLICASFKTGAIGSESPPALTKNPDGEVAVLRFEAKIAGEIFRCDGEPQSIASTDDADETGSADSAGSARLELIPNDLRFFVHAIELRDSENAWHSATLVADGHWQTGETALLDFENGTERCRNGSASVRTTVDLEAPGFETTAIRFRLGVPFDANHQNPAKAPSPLNMTAMHWNWNGGYKFLRFGGRLDSGQSYRVHLGSTGCEGTIGNISACAHPNRPAVEIEPFDLARDQVVFDISALIKGADLSTTDPKTKKPGCMGDATDPGCAAVFKNLGLNIENGEPLGSGQVFSR